MTTNPGNIPEEREWDMPDDIIYHSKAYASEFTNEEINEDLTDPREPAHFDYRFLRSNAGPIFEGEFGADSEGSQKKNAAPQVMQFERKKYGGIRMCQRCLRTKPDRTHHCSYCNKCVLKMDHHCPWVANCVGFYNYKYFLNMLFYASLTSLIVVVTAYPVFIAVLAHEGLDPKVSYFVVTAWILAAAFCFVITGFFAFHLWLLSN